MQGGGVDGHGGQMKAGARIRTQNGVNEVAAALLILACDAESFRQLRDAVSVLSGSPFFETLLSSLEVRCCMRTV